MELVLWGGTERKLDAPNHNFAVEAVDWQELNRLAIAAGGAGVSFKILDLRSMIFV